MPKATKATWPSGVPVFKLASRNYFVVGVWVEHGSIKVQCAKCPGCGKVIKRSADVNVFNRPRQERV